MNTPNFTEEQYTENHLITLHSNDATTFNNGSYLSNIIFQFTGLLKPDKKIIRNEIMLLKAEIPSSFYAINSNNNILSYYTTSNKTITISNGNYNANTFITAMNTLFSANGDTFSITINNSNGILTFSNSSSFTFFYSSSSIFGVLGLNTTTNYSSSSNSLTCIYPLNLLPPKRLTMKSNSLISNNFSSSNKGLDSVLGVIQVNQPSFNLIVYQAQQTDAHLLKNNFIDSIDIQILDENNNFINFNGIDWCITLLLKSTKIITIFQSSDINDLINNF